MADYTNEPSFAQALEANFAKPISQLRKIVKRKRDFRKTVAFSSHQAWRHIAAYGNHSYLTWAERRVNIRLCNLWLHHMGRDGFIEPDHVALQKKLGISERTLGRAISKLRSLGILKLLSGGRGRGHKARYGFDLTAMMEQLWPGFMVVSSDEGATIDGEIKPVTYVRDYQTTKDMRAGKFARRRNAALRIGGLRLPRGMEGAWQKVLAAMLSASQASFHSLPSGHHWKAKFGPIPKAGMSESLRNDHAAARTGQPSTWLIARLNGINPHMERLA